jgi:hypothetical protein
MADEDVSPMPDEPEFEDIEELHAQMRSLLRAQVLLDATEHDPGELRDVIAEMLDQIRHTGEVIRAWARVLRMQPTMAERIADWMTDIADVLDPVAPEDE